MKQQRILVAPLDWGLGHATRCVPIINSFLKDNQHVIISTNGRAEQFLKREFPDLEFIESPAYDVRYSRWIPMWLMLLLQIPKIIYVILSEHKWLSKIVAERKIDLVISDNRYGLWSKKTRCIFITHQMMIKLPAPFKFLESAVHSIVLWFVNKYTECWVPDAEGEINLSGDLSHKYKLPENTKFIGLLSRFNREKNNSTTNEYSVCFILGGPEPQRTVFENKILFIRNQIPGKNILIQGLPGEKGTIISSENFKVFPHLDKEEFEFAIRSSRIIVCRAGYSSLMDLELFEKVAIIIPTPGQTEQEYLAYHLKNRIKYFSINQNQIDAELAPLIKTILNSEIKEEKNILDMTTEYSIEY